MPATKIISNKNTLLALAPKSLFPDVRTPTLAQLQAATNVSEAVKWDGYDLKLDTSDTDEDRALTDAANAATRGYENFGGTVSFYEPTPTDTSSIYRVARNMVAVPQTELVAIQRDGMSAAAPFAAGQVVNIFHVITDANSRERGDKNRYYKIDFKKKGFVGVNRIIPSASPKAVTVTPGSSLAVTVGKAIQLRATYEGNDITVGATWISSDVTKAVVTPHGLLIGIAAGSANITATYPGSAAGSPIAATVS